MALRVYYSVGSNLEYSRITELGGKIHPKNGKYLVFEVDGHLVFTTEVEIPSQPYLRPAFDEKRAEAVLAVGAVFQQAIAQYVTLR